MNDRQPDPLRFCDAKNGQCRMQDIESRSPCGPTIALKTISIRAEPSDLRFAGRQYFFLDPFYALLNGRAQRGETARRALLSQLCGGVDCLPQVDSGALPEIGFLESVIEPDSMTLLLGWYIPPSRIEKLDRAIVPSEEVEYSAAGYGIFQSMSENTESVEEFVRLLDPGLSKLLSAARFAKIT